MPRESKVFAHERKLLAGLAFQLMWPPVLVVDIWFHAYKTSENLASLTRFLRELLAP